VKLRYAPRAHADIARYPYLVYHRVREGEVVIIHVRDGRRDVPKEREL